MAETYLTSPMYSKSSKPRAALIPWLLSVLSLAFALGGCISRTPESSSGTLIDAAKVAKIVKGKTTRAEVEAMFGKPDMTSMLPDGRRMISYSYSSSRFDVNSGAILRAAFTASGPMAKGSTRTQGLQIYVSKEGIVEDYEFNDNTRDIQSYGDGSMQSQKR